MLFILSLIVLAWSGVVDFHSCLPQGCTLKYKVNEITVEPDKPKAGTMLHVDFKGDVLVSAVGGEMEIKIFMGGVKMFEYDFDFCKVLECGCPTKLGAQEGHIEQAIPKLIIPGMYNITTQVYDSQKNQITCVEFMYQLYS